MAQGADVLIGTHQRLEDGEWRAVSLADVRCGDVIRFAHTNGRLGDPIIVSRASGDLPSLADAPGSTTPRPPANGR